MKLSLMKFLLVLVLAVLYGCTNSPKVQDYMHDDKESKTTDSIESESISLLDILTNKRKSEPDSVIFDYSMLPAELVYYVQTELDSLRFPLESDYNENDIRYGDPEMKELPFYCSGYFTHDSVIDYAAVLVKDSTMNYLFAFNPNEYSFDHYLLNYTDLYPGDSGGKYVNIMIYKDTVRELIDILGDTTIVETESIVVSDLYNSRTHRKYWNESSNNYKGWVAD